MKRLTNLNDIDLGIRFDSSGCWICGAPCVGYLVTCSEDCHEELVLRFELKYGIYKRVVDLETMKTHKVPLRNIIEKGLRQQDLKNYPELIPEES